MFCVTMLLIVTQNIGVLKVVSSKCQIANKTEDCNVLRRGHVTGQEKKTLLKSRSTSASVAWEMDALSCAHNRILRNLPS